MSSGFISLTTPVAGENEYLFEVDEYKEMIHWINAINLHGNPGKPKLSEDKVYGFESYLLIIL